MKKWILGFGMIVMGINVVGQNINPANLTNIIPPSPEVSALGKYTEIPVNLASGLPAISLPLHNIVAKEISIPLSLSYNASGIRVEEVATWVGLGWSLSTGASLYRTVVGLNDDLPVNGFMYTTKTVPYIAGLNTQGSEFFDIMHNQVNAGVLDVEPDIFNFSIENYSGKFTYNQTTGQFMCTPYSNIVIAYTTNGSLINSFTITLPNGHKYYFGVSKDGQRTAFERLQSQHVAVQDLNGSISLPPPANAVNLCYNKWELCTATADNVDVEYYYTSYNSSDFSKNGETKDHLSSAGAGSCIGVGGVKGSASYSVQYFNKARLTKISTPFEEVDFIAETTNRIDMVGDNKMLKKIVATNKLNQKISEYELVYQYNTSADAPYFQALGAYTQTARHRPFLMQVNRINNDNNVIQNEYMLSYSAVNLPSRLSTSQDYWGYFNGKSNGNSLVPKIYMKNLQSNGAGFLSGADRTLDTVLCQAGILKSIQYATGGQTNYTYESNTINPLHYGYYLDKFIQSYLQDNEAWFLKTASNQNTSNPNLYTYNFTIPNNIVGDVNFVTTVADCPNNLNTIDCPVNLQIKGITNPTFSAPIGGANFYLTLPPGSYYLQAILTPTTQFPNPDFTVNIKWQANVNPHRVFYGGLRIKQIENIDSMGSKILKRFVYNRFDSVVSSGIPAALPLHAYKIHCGNTPTSTPTVLRQVSNSCLPLSSPDGKLVQYDNITEYSTELANSYKTEYTFSYDWFHYIQPSDENYPIMYHTFKDWRMGNNTKTVKYQQTNIGLKPIEIQNFKKKHYAELVNSNFGIRIASYALDGFGYKYYKHATEWYVDDEVETITYDNTNPSSPKQLVTKVNYNYNNKYYPSETQTTNSKQQLIKTAFKYPFELTTNPACNLLTIRNQIDKPVELKVENATASKATAGSKLTYDNVGNNLVEVTEVYKLNIDNTNNYTREILVTKYNKYGDVEEIRGADGIITCYIYGYNTQYPVAKIVGTTWATANAVFNTTDLAEINTPTTDIALRNVLQKLRTNLSNVFVSTYTYKPLVGITSETDANGKTTTYEYDSFNRLKLIRDFNNNILKTFDYKYKQTY